MQASLGPIRTLGTKLVNTPKEKIRPISMDDFKNAISVIRPSVSQESLGAYESWNKERGVSG